MLKYTFQVHRETNSYERSTLSLGVIYLDVYYSSSTPYEMLGMKDPPNTYSDLSSQQGMVYL
jgi:hypothetical protein